MGEGGGSLGVQRLKSHLSPRGTWVWSLLQEDPTCWRAAKPTLHNYWLCALKLNSRNFWSPCAESPGSAREATAMRGPPAARERRLHSLRREEAHMQRWGSSVAKKTQQSLKKKWKIGNGPSVHLEDCIYKLCESIQCNIMRDLRKCLQDNVKLSKRRIQNWIQYYISYINIYMHRENVEENKTKLTILP